MKHIIFPLFIFLAFSSNIFAQVAVFPAFEAEDLNKKTVNIPQDVYAKKTLLIVPFKQKQQEDIYDFLAQIDPILQDNLDFDFLEIPTISSWWTWFNLNSWIDNGMRSGIQDFETRKRTITRYIDVDDFLESMNIPDKTKVCYYLIDDTGKIYWQHIGKASSADIEQLKLAVTQFM